MCNDKKKHFNDTIQILPEHITQNIVYFIGCKFCKKTFEGCDLCDEIEALKKQRNKKNERRKLELQVDRISQEREHIYDEHDENSFTY